LLLLLLLSAEEEDCKLNSLNISVDDLLYSGHLSSHIGVKVNTIIIVPIGTDVQTYIILIYLDTSCLFVCFVRTFCVAVVCIYGDCVFDPGY
jgi:hypothetical protein